MIDPMCVATQGFQSRAVHNFPLAVAVLGWICIAAPVPPTPPTPGGGGGGFGWYCPPRRYVTCEDPEEFVSAKTIAMAIAIVVVGRSDPLRVAASIALTVDGGCTVDEDDSCD
jgi:hypothetical protein